MLLMKKTPLWIASKGLLAERGADFFRCWERTASTFDPEDIHDLRVASRRLRESLALFESSYPEERIRYLRKRVGKVTALLGELRNLDVWLAFMGDEVSELEDEDGEISARLGRFEQERKETRKKVERDLRKLNYASLRKYFVRTVHAPFLFDPPPGVPDPFTPIEDYARSAVELRLAPILNLVPVALIPDQADAQHQLRIAVKRFRYRLEILSPLMDQAGYRELHGHVKEYQEILGRIHDLDVFAAMTEATDLPVSAKNAIGAHLAVKRSDFFARFRDKTGKISFDVIGAAVRRIM